MDLDFLQAQAQPVQINVCCLAVLMMMTQEETYVVSCLLLTAV